MTSIKKILLFLVLSFLILKIFDWGVGNRMDWISAKNFLGESGGKINYYITESPDVEFLIMGNSRARHNIIPEMLNPSSYSLTHNGLKISFHAALFHQLYSINKLPDTVLIHLDPFELYQPNILQDVLYLRYFYGKDSLITSYINKLSSYERIKFSFSSYRYNGVALNIIKNAFFTIKNQTHDPGYYRLPTEICGSEKLGIERIRQATSQSIINEDYFRFLDLIIDTGNKGNCFVIFYTAPLYFELDIFESAASHMVSDYLNEKEMIYLDFLNEPTMTHEFPDKYWCDQWHFNSDGADYFTQILKLELDRVLRN